MSITKYETPFAQIVERLSTEITPSQLVETFDHIKYLEAALKDIQRIARNRVLQMVNVGGKQITDNGTKELSVGEWRLEIQPQRTGYDPKKVEPALRMKGLDPELYMDVDISYRASEEKINKAIKDGVFTKDEAELLKHDLEYKVMSPKRVIK